MGETERGSGLMTGDPGTPALPPTAVSTASLSAFLFFFFCFFPAAVLPWGELSGLVPVECCFLRAATCAGVPRWASKSDRTMPCW